MKLVNRWPLALMLALASMILKRMPELAFKTLSFALAVIVATYAMGRIVGIMQLKPQSLVARPRTSYFVALGFASAVVYFWFDKGREHRNLAWAIAICLFVAAVVLPFRYYAPTPENIGVPTPIYPEEIAQWLMERERRHAPFLDGDSGTVESHIVWAAGLEHARADVVVLSVHGWSATPRECEPVPTALATALGAHLYKHRLVGHGLAPDKPRGSEALLREATRNALLRDVVVAWKIARTLGRRVVVFGCSTGATLLSWLIAQARRRARPGAAIPGAALTPLPPTRLLLPHPPCTQPSPRRCLSAVDARRRVRSRERRDLRIAGLRSRLAGVPRGEVDVAPSSAAVRLLAAARSDGLLHVRVARARGAAAVRAE